MHSCCVERPCRMTATGSEVIGTGDDESLEGHVEGGSVLLAIHTEVAIAQADRPKMGHVISHIAVHLPITLCPAAAGITAGGKSQVRNDRSRETRATEGVPPIVPSGEVPRITVRTIDTQFVLQTPVSRAGEHVECPRRVAD